MLLVLIPGPSPTSLDSVPRLSDEDSGNMLSSQTSANLLRGWIELITDQSISYPHPQARLYTDVAQAGDEENHTIQGAIKIPNTTYCIAGKFGGKLNLAVWQSVFATAYFKSANISNSHTYVWHSLTKLPKFKSTSIFVMAIWGPTAKFNPYPYFWLYSVPYSRNFFLSVKTTVIVNTFR